MNGDSFQLAPPATTLRRDQPKSAPGVHETRQPKGGPALTLLAPLDMSMSFTFLHKLAETTVV